MENAPKQYPYIVTITSADSYVAVYKIPILPYVASLSMICFALVEDESGKRTIRGMYGIDENGFCDTKPGFLGYSTKPFEIKHWESQRLKH